MTNQEFLKKIESEYVEESEHLASESEAETREKRFADLGIRKLEEMEDDAWKRVIRIDENLDIVRKRINEVYYYDDREMPNKLGLISALLEYEQRIVAARKKLTDTAIRAITDRQKVLLRVNLVRRGGAGDVEE